MRRHGFTVRTSQAAKGIAILMMVFHHMFRAPELYEGYVVRFYPLAEYQVTQLFSYFKTCVGLFAFITGYGLCKSWERDMGSGGEWKSLYARFTASHYAKLLRSFALIFVLSAVICQALDGATARAYFTGSSWIENLMNLLMGFLGLYRIVGTGKLCAEWWYLSAHILFIFLVPLLCVWMRRLGVLSLAFVLLALPRTISGGYPGGTVPLSFVAPMATGAAFAYYGVFDRIHTFRVRYFTGSGLRRMGGAALAVCAVAVSCWLYIRLPVRLYWELSYTLPAVCILAALNEYLPEDGLLSGALCFLGRHSMNIWLTHTLIRGYLMDFLYQQPHFILSCVSLLVISVLVSLAIEGIRALLKQLVSFVYARQGR